MDQVCIAGVTEYAGIIGAIVTGASMLSNIVPSPDKAETSLGKIFSKIVHFIAVDIVTAVKK